MLYKNIKQSIDTLSVFTRLEDKLHTGECIIKNANEIESVIGTSCQILINIDYLGKNIAICLYESGVLSIFGEMIPKHYEQLLTDDEFLNVKNRIIKIVQKHQDNFENLLKDSDINYGIDGE